MLALGPPSDWQDTRKNQKFEKKNCFVFVCGCVSAGNLNLMKTSVILRHLLCKESGAFIIGLIFRHQTSIITDFLETLT